MNSISQTSEQLLPSLRSDERAAHILVVDDLPANTRVLEDLLTRDGYRVTVAGDGERALEVVTQEHPDLVLLDILMPKMDGYEVCRRLKSDPSTRLIPVVIMTSSREERDVLESYKLGVNSYVVKPMDFESFSAAVAELGHYWLLVNHEPK